MNNKWYRILRFIVCVLLAFFPVSPSALAEDALRFADVYPDTGVVGTSMPVTIKGTGIGSGTRISMNLDVKSPTIGEFASICWKTAVSGNMVYLCALDSLKILDVSDPSGPVLLSTVTTPGNPADVAVSGSTAYVIDLTGLQIIDVSDPVNPERKGYLYLPGKTWSIYSSGHLV